LVAEHSNCAIAKIPTKLSSAIPARAVPRSGLPKRGYMPTLMRETKAIPALLIWITSHAGLDRNIAGSAQKIT
jgi:hypothetical protein